MRKSIAIILALMMVVCLQACGGNTDTVDNTEEVTSSALTESTVQETTTVLTTTKASTQPTTQAPTKAAVVVTEPEEESGFKPYLQKIYRDDFPVWSEPTYNSRTVGTVQKAGTYTIVQECKDQEGNLWGKLKSGMGWVDLTLNKSEQTSKPLVTASEADSALINSGNCHYCVIDETEYAFPVALYVHSNVMNVRLYTMVLDSVGEQVYQLGSMSPGVPLVAQLAFPGDLSSYLIRVTDSSGVTHSYTICTSGRNNSIQLIPYYN